MKPGSAISPRRPGLALASYVFLFSILIYSAAWNIFRDIGAPGLFVLTLTTLPFLFYLKQIKINMYMIAFCAITSVYLVLSLMEVFDRSWTNYFSKFAALRQAFYAVGLPLFVIASAGTATYFRKAGRENWMFLLMLIMGGIVGPVLYTVFGDDRYDNLADRLQLNALVNIEMLFVLALGYFVLASQKIPKWLGILVVISFVVFSTHLQAQLTTLLLLVFLLGLPPRLVMYGAIAGMFVLILALLPFGYAFRDIDPNVGVRIFMWQDAIRAFVDSNGTGIGFGTEYITNIYPFNSQIHVTEYMREGFQYVGNHSTFFTILMRMGVIGLVSFFMLLFSFMPTRGHLYRNIRGEIIQRGDPFLCWIFTILVLSFASNVALASLNFFIGNAFVIGYLMSLKQLDAK